MKYQLPILLFLLFVPVVGSATQDNYLFVWHEDDYIQGSWKRARIIEGRPPRYLRPVLYVEMMGTVQLDIPLTILERLAAKRPDAYRWKREIEIKGDTVVITSSQAIPGLESIRNEVTLSMVMQSGFNHVTFVQPEGRSTYSLADINIPWFDIRRPGEGFQEVPTKVDEIKPDNDKEEEENGEEPNEEVDTPATVVPIDTIDMTESSANEGDGSGIEVWHLILVALIAGGAGFGLAKAGKNS